MDKATHILYRRCTECPEARRTLQRMGSIADRVAFVRDHYHTLYDEEVVRAITKGVSRDGSQLMPPMAYWAYDRMRQEDVAAIVAWLRTVPPVEAQ